MAVVILAFGPQSLVIVNYGVTLIFAILTQQQLTNRNEEHEVDSPEENRNTDSAEQISSNSEQNSSSRNQNNQSESENVPSEGMESNPSGEGGSQNVAGNDNSEGERSENRIHSMFRNLREKYIFNEEL